MLHANERLDELFAELDAAGIQLYLEADRLRYTAPQGALTPDLRTRLQHHKQELIELLRRKEAAESGPGGRIFPVSFAQRRFWALQRMNHDIPFFNEPFSFRVRGPIHFDALRKSFAEVIRRHESLRTTLQERDGNLVQVIAPTGEMKIQMEDVTTLEAEARENEINRIIVEEMLTPFDHAHDPGVRVLLIKAAEEDHVLQFTLHNTLFDGSSLMILLDEVSAHYAAFLEDKTISLPAPTQYREYVKWQAALPDSHQQEREAYWREWFKNGEPPQWNWPDGKPAKAESRFETYAPTMECSAELTEQLKALSRRSGVTLYITALTAYAVFLYGSHGCPDLTFGTTYSNRNRWDFSSLIGASIDVPALRADLSDNPVFTTLLNRMRGIVTEALTHQSVPYDMASRQFQTRRTLSAPLFKVMFSFLPEMPHGRLLLPGAEAEFLEKIINEISRPDLYLVLWESPSEAGPRLHGYWLFRKDVFEPETVEKMTARWMALLAAIAAQPAATVSALCAGEPASA